MKLRVKIGISTLLVFVIFIACWWSIEKTKRDAERFFNKALLLQVDRSTVGDVLALVMVSGGTSYGFDSCIKGQGGCIGTIYFENRLLRYLHAAPRTAFGARFGIEESKLTNTWFMMYSISGNHDWEAFVDEGDHLWDGKSFTFKTFSGRFGILMSPDTPSDIRKLAYSFNFCCLTRIGGCRTQEEMLPILNRKDLIGPHPEVLNPNG
jgi:hypothetical protein